MKENKIAEDIRDIGYIFNMEISFVYSPCFPLKVPISLKAPISLFKIVEYRIFF